MEIFNKDIQAARDTDELINLKSILHICLTKWYWFAVSIVTMLIAGYIYIKKTPPTYVRTASIIVKDDSKGALSAETSAFQEIGLMQTNTNVNNEIISMKSYDVMTEVVKRLGLDISYKTKGRFYDPVLYGNNLPIKIVFEGLGNNQTAKFVIKISGNNIHLSDFSLGDKEINNSTTTGIIGDTLNTVIGKIIVTRNIYFTGEDVISPIYISKNRINDIVATYSRALNVNLKNEKASVVDLSISDVSIQRAEDILNTIIAVYNEKWISDRNQVAVSTSNFINDRLSIIEKELGSVEENISEYKSKNLLPDLQSASSMYQNQSNETASRIIELNTQISLARYIKSYMATTSDNYRLFPSNAGLNNTDIATLVLNYNSMVLERNSLARNSSNSNPVISDMDKNLEEMRGVILTSIDEYINSLEIQLGDLQKTEASIRERIAESPSQAKYLLSVERQQKVKESLYLFLLQKREENELSQAFTAYNTRIINEPSGSMIPVSPQSRNIMLIALFIGILIPIAVIFILEMLNTRVRSKKDLELLTIPYIGEIPLSYKKEKHFIMRWKKNVEKREIVVKEKNRNIINEAFRVVRTNFEFLLGNNGKNKVVMFTSMNQGSGKTFISMNLAMAFAIKGKKTIVIDLDMRKAALSEFISSPKNGVSDFLNGRVFDYEKIIIRGHFNPYLDMIPVGTIPPNPTELLFDERLSLMLDALKNEYDYIFIDCPPMEIVADSAIIAKYADMTIFVVRAELMEKSLLPQVESYYQEKKFHSMALLLNGTEVYGGYGYNSYGYRSYGYSYSD